MALKSLDRDIDEAIYPFPSGNVLVHDKQEHRGIGLTPRIGWLGMDIQTLHPDPWDRLPATAEGAPGTGCHNWQGVRAAAMSAAELLIGRATRALDVDHRSLEAVEPRPFGIDDRLLPLIQIVDAHGNGAGFSACLGEETDEATADSEADRRMPDHGHEHLVRAGAPPAMPGELLQLPQER